MPNIKQIQLKGSTILEVLIALTITTVCTCISVIIYLNIQSSSVPFFKIKAVELSEQFLRKTVDEQSYQDETFKTEGFSIKKKIDKHPIYNDCLIIRILVFDQSRKLITELEATVKERNELKFEF